MKSLLPVMPALVSALLFASTAAPAHAETVPSCNTAWWNFDDVGPTMASQDAQRLVRLPVAWYADYPGDWASNTTPDSSALSIVVTNSDGVEVAGQIESTLVQGLGFEPPAPVVWWRPTDGEALAAGTYTARLTVPGAPGPRAGACSYLTGEEEFIFTIVPPETAEGPSLTINMRWDHFDPGHAFETNDCEPSWRAAQCPSPLEHLCCAKITGIEWRGALAFDDEVAGWWDLHAVRIDVAITPPASIEWPSDGPNHYNLGRNWRSAWSNNESTGGTAGRLFTKAPFSQLTGAAGANESWRVCATLTIRDLATGVDRAPEVICSDSADLAPLDEPLACNTELCVDTTAEPQPEPGPEPVADGDLVPDAEPVVEPMAEPGAETGWEIPWTNPNAEQVVEADFESPPDDDGCGSGSSENAAWLFAACALAFAARRRRDQTRV